jgi:hypothetical protein
MMVAGACDAETGVCDVPDRCWVRQSAAQTRTVVNSGLGVEGKNTIVART